MEANQFSSYYETPVAKLATQEQIESEKLRMDFAVAVEDKELFPDVPFENGYHFPREQ